QNGAFGFLTKPVDKDELLEQVRKALKISGFTQADEEWRAEIITCSTLMEEKLAQAQKVAATDTHVMVIGENGTGKGLFARAIHKASPRSTHPFVSVDCTIIDEAGLEAQLFDRSLREAAGGTLMLAEVASLPLRLQARLAAAL